MVRCFVFLLTEWDHTIHIREYQSEQADEEAASNPESNVEPVFIPVDATQQEQVERRERYDLQRVQIVDAAEGEQHHT